MLRNHGIITAGRTIPEAFHLAHYFEQCCRTQIEVMATGAAIQTLPDHVIKHGAAQFDAIYSKVMPGEREWPTLVRIVEREDPSLLN